jgi:hypothetical protein
VPSAVSRNSFWSRITSTISGLRSATPATMPPTSSSSAAPYTSTRGRSTPRRLALDAVLGGVADQPARRADLVHHVVAGVDAGAAGDALVLQAVADVDAGRAHLHADRAVDAVALAFGLRALAARAARLAALSS